MRDMRELSEVTRAMWDACPYQVATHMIQVVWDCGLGRITPYVAGESERRILGEYPYGAGNWIASRLRGGYPGSYTTRGPAFLGGLVGADVLLQPPTAKRLTNFDNILYVRKGEIHYRSVTISGLTLTPIRSVDSEPAAATRCLYIDEENDPHIDLDSPNKNIYRRRGVAWFQIAGPCWESNCNARGVERRLFAGGDDTDARDHEVTIACDLHSDAGMNWNGL